MPPSIFQGGVVGGQRSVGLGGLNSLAATPIIGPSAATVPARPPSKLVGVDQSNVISGDASTGQGGQSATALSAEALAAAANTGQGQGASSAGSESLAGSSVTAQGQTAAAAGSESVSAQSGTGQGQGATSAGSEAVSAQSSTAQGQSAASSGSESVSSTVATAQGGQEVSASDIPAIAGVADTGQAGQEASSNGLVSLGVGQLVDAGGDGAWKHRIVWPTPKPLEGPEAIVGDAVTAQSSNVIAIGSLGVRGQGATRTAQLSAGYGDTYDYELEQFVLLMAEAA